MKKKVKVVTFAIAILWTIIYLFAVKHNSSNERFAVVQFQATEIKPAITQVQVSPSLAWDEAKGVSTVVSLVFLIVMWVLFAACAVDFHLAFVNDPKKVGTAANLAVIIPMAISFAFLLSAYSSMQQNNFVEVPKEQFVQWEQQRMIEQKGERTWVDKSEHKVLASLFANREFIK